MPIIFFLLLANALSMSHHFTFATSCWFHGESCFKIMHIFKVTIQLLSYFVAIPFHHLCTSTPKIKHLVSPLSPSEQFACHLSNRYHSPSQYRHRRKRLYGTTRFPRHYHLRQKLDSQIANAINYHSINKISSSSSSSKTSSSPTPFHNVSLQSDPSVQFLQVILRKSNPQNNC